MHQPEGLKREEQAYPLPLSILRNHPGLIKLLPWGISPSWTEYTVFRMA